MMTDPYTLQLEQLEQEHLSRVASETPPAFHTPHSSLLAPPRTTARKLVEPSGPPKKLLFVYNPVSGRMMLKSYLSEVIRAFSLNGYLVTAYPTAASGDAISFIRTYAEAYDLIVVSGGDGTFNEAATALLDAGIDRPLGYIPTGSTNVFAESHGIPMNPIEAAEAIVMGRETKIDVGNMNGRWFTFVAAFGLFTGLSYTTSQALKNVFGKGAYVLDAVTDFFRTRRVHVKVTGTGYFPLIQSDVVSFSKKKEGVLAEGDYLLGCVNNANSIASVVYLPASLVSYNDGLFEIMMIRYPDVQLDIQNTISDIRSEGYFDSPYCTVFRASAFHLTIDDGISWALDGEKGEGHTEIDFRVVKEGLRVILPIV